MSTPDAVRRALAQRLRAAGTVLSQHPLPAPDPDPARDAAVLLDLLVHRVRAQLAADGAWLLYTALAGQLPTCDQLLEVVRHLELATVPEATLWLLDTCLRGARSGEPARELRVVPGGVVVDVDHSARHDLHTGIQQVVRNTIPYWDRDRDIVPVVWVPGFGAQRALNQRERQRAMNWQAGTNAAAAVAEDAVDPPLVVPWRGTVVLAEVPATDACERLAALAHHSGNRLVAIGYDCVPIVSADMLPIAEPNRFARYLTVIKHADRVAGISASAAAEFRGFTHTLTAQGLAGPRVVECLLPSDGMAATPPEIPPAAAAERPARRRSRPVRPPTVLTVGSFEPRKNHLAVLHAAETLWREGLTFRLWMIGGSGWGQELPQRVRALQAKGRPLRTESRVSAERLAAAYRDARFTVFPSLHEGYGLPVAESLAFGTPVVTSRYGSTREIGELNGAVLVDPRDDQALIAAIRTLLTDDERLAALRRQAAARPARSWADYAEQAWACLVGADADDSEAAE